MIWQWIGGNEFADNGDLRPSPRRSTAVTTVCKTARTGWRWRRRPGIENPLPRPLQHNRRSKPWHLSHDASSALINAFTPLAAEKINRGTRTSHRQARSGRAGDWRDHRDGQGSDGQDDPIEAVAAAKADLSIMQQVAETSALDAPKLEPMLKAARHAAAVPNGRGDLAMQQRSVRAPSLWDEQDASCSGRWA